MNKNDIVLNMFVFSEDLTKGTKQVKLLEKINLLGITKAEIRREFIKDFSSELTEIKEKAHELRIELFYSIPKYLYKNGILLSKEIKDYFMESNKMNCNHVKMNIGDVHDVSEQDVKILNELCSEYSIILSIENDQSKGNGRIEKILKFLKLCKEKGLKITSTFDIGNWVWLNENPTENATKLKDYVTYIHLKDVIKDEKPRTILLDEGVLPWRKILNIFKDNLPVALEYSCYPDPLITLAKEIKKLEEFHRL